jgi:hypothetical protein
MISHSHPRHSGKRWAAVLDFGFRRSDENFCRWKN